MRSRTDIENDYRLACYTAGDLLMAKKQAEDKIQLIEIEIAKCHKKVVDIIAEHNQAVEVEKQVAAAAKKPATPVNPATAPNATPVNPETAPNATPVNTSSADEAVPVHEQSR